jgi:hypothetical protein
MEEMTVWGHSAPTVPLSCHIIKADLTPAEQTTYADAVALFAADTYTNITNTTAELSISRITSDAITVETEDVDFLTLSEADKAKLDALLALFVANNEIP